MRLSDPFSLAAKAGIASTLAVLATRWLGVDDALSAGFVALACVSPSAFAGLKNGLQQLLGSALACGIAGAPIVLWPALRGSPWLLLPSVGIVIIACFGLKLRSAYLVAGFSVLYLHLLPLGSAVSGIALRIEAVVIGALVAAVVNTIVSSLASGPVAARRIRIAKETVARDLETGAAWLSNRTKASAPTFDAAFSVVRELRADLDAGARERLFPGAPRARESAERGLRMAESLERSAHLAKEITLLVGESTEADADLPLARAELERAALVLMGNEPGALLNLEGSTLAQKPENALLSALGRLREAVGQAC